MRLVVEGKLQAATGAVQVVLVDGYRRGGVAGGAVVVAYGSVDGGECG